MKGKTGKNYMSGGDLKIVKVWLLRLLKGMKIGCTLRALPKAARPASI